MNTNQWVVWTAAAGWWLFLLLLCSENPPRVVELPRGPVDELTRDRLVPYDQPATWREQPLLSSFGGYGCASSSCGRHVAGYRWAQEHNITDPHNCDGDSTAFSEGCRVFANSRAGPSTSE